jgi:hypothetical protein
MIRQLVPIAAIVMALWLGNGSQAAIMLSLHTDHDLDDLTVGQTVSFDVILSGLNTPAGESLDYLAAQVVFDPMVFENPIEPIAGDIVPDDTGFLGLSFDHLVDGSYDREFALLDPAPIVNDGVFFSFTLDVHTSGSGQVSLDFVDYAVTPASVVPEPATGILFLLGAVPVILCGRRRGA